MISTFYPALLGVQQVLQTSLPSPTSSTIRPLPSATPSVSVSHRSKPAVNLGIALGVPLAILLFACLGFVFYKLRKRRQSAQSQPNAVSTFPPVMANSEEIHDTQIARLQELDTDGGRHEAHGTGLLPYSRELPGSPGLLRAELSTEKL